MLFIESRTLRLKLDGPGRIRLLEELREKNLVPLIRAARLNLFNQVLSGSERVDELESEMALAASSDK